jgi:hypothetical protein
VSNEPVSPSAGVSPAIRSGPRSIRDIAVFNQCAAIRALASQRGDYANRIAVLQKLADAAKGDEKKELPAAANAAAALLKTVDTFVESLNHQTSDQMREVKSPVAN